MKKSLTLLTLLLLSVCSGYAQGNKPMQAPTDKALHFRENKGQIVDQYGKARKDIDFKVSGGKGLNVFIGRQGLSYQWAKKVRGQSAVGSLHLLTDSDKEEMDSYELYRMEVELVGANTKAKMITEGLQNSYERYFQPWVNTSNSNTGVRAAAFAQVTYKDIYPGIDWVLYFSEEGKMEYDFVVHPGGKVANIQLQYSGSDKLELLADGGLRAQSPFGIVQENKPISFTKNGLPVTSRFVLQESVVSFAVADYSCTLTIDPVVEWGSYFGGNADEVKALTVVDKWQNVYLAGSTSSVANIATTGAHQHTFGGGVATLGADAYLCKWDATGQLLWSSYYGGTNIDAARGLACDTLGHVYFGGYTNSSNGIATTGAYQFAKMGTANRYDAFLVKMDSSGERQWGTYFGGTLNDANTSFHLCSDKWGNTYITGSTESTNNIATVGSHQATKASGNDGFLAHFDTEGNRIWATYTGGNLNATPTAIAVDEIGKVYWTGYTASTAGIASTGAHQPNFSGVQDVFLMQFDSLGQKAWGTYLGGTELDRPHAVAAKDGRVIIAGLTLSATGIATANSYQSAIANNTHDEGFAAVFLDDGTIAWSTYFGGELNDQITGVFINNQNEIFLVGNSSSIIGIATAGSYQEQLSGVNSDAFLAKFHAGGARIWSTYLGGVDEENNTAVFGDAAYTVYVSGNTGSATNIATANAFQPSLNGGFDAFLVKFNDCYQPESADTILGPLVICAGASATYSVAVDTQVAYYQWVLPDGALVTSDTNSILITMGDISGLLRVISYSACGGVSDTQSLSITVLPSPQPIIVRSDNILATTQSYATYQWMREGIDITGAINPTYIATQNGAYAVRVSNPSGCSAISDTMMLTGLVSISNLAKDNHVRLFPNPAQAYLFIDVVQACNTHLFTVEGKLVGQFALLPGQNKIVLDGLTAGMYYMVIYTEGEATKTYKFSKG